MVKAMSLGPKRPTKSANFSSPPEIEIEKQGLNFDIIKIKLTGQTVPPIEIKAS